MSDSLKAKYWVGILWCSSMVDNWRDLLEVTLQMPYCYCVHDKDLNFHGEEKAAHVHLMVAYNNTTTEAFIKSIFNQLSRPGMQCCNKLFRVLRIRYMYNYLIHDTDQARKDQKHIYDSSERVCGLGFDPDLLQEQQIIDKQLMVKEISHAIIEHQIFNYADLYILIENEFDLSYHEILLSYSGHFDRMCTGCWRKFKQ